MRLLPREEKFYNLFQQQAQLIAQASTSLLKGVRAGNAHLAEAAAEIQALEGKGDEIIHDILTRLNQTFITPIDPEDIHKLSSSLDDVLDGIEDAAYRMAAYRLDPIPPSVVDLCEIVDACSRVLVSACDALNSDKPLLEHCIEINRLEDVADKLVRRVLAELFQSDLHPIAFIKLKEVYEVLEATTDRCEDVADTLQGVVVKNS
jgi:predicted phosphate transport protein (TIGR00153 family)